MHPFCFIGYSTFAQVRNKSSLVELLSSFLPEREAEGHFLEERQYIVNYIKQLGWPEAPQPLARSTTL